MTKMDVTDSEFQEKVVEQSKKVPVIVDFWASWCGPCMILKPVLEKVAEDLDGKVVLAKVDVDKHQENARKHNVSSIPDVKLFKDGKVAGEFVGSRPEATVKEWLKEHM